MSTSFSTTSFLQTKKMGRSAARHILQAGKGNGAAVLGLVGDLGGGKTTFAQGFAQGLGIKEKILSPTFVILKKFKIRNKKFDNFYHIDCYRIRSPKELLSLGFKKIISRPENIVVIEWADLIKKIMPQGAIWLDFKFIDEKTRKIVVR